MANGDQSIGYFRRKITTGSNEQVDGNLYVAEGNETRILKGFITITGTAAVADRNVCPIPRSWQMTKISCRETTAVVNAGTDVGTILVDTAAQGTAVASVVNAVTITVSTGTFTGATTNSIDISFNGVDIYGGTYLQLRHTQATGGSAAGVASVNVFGREKLLS